MKKILLSVLLVALVVSINAQDRKPLRGFYAKITLINNDSIPVEDNVLKAKTYPTVWYFAEIDTNYIGNNAKVGFDQTARFKYSYKLYYDYYQYWNYTRFNALRMVLPTSFETGWVSVFDGDYSFETDMPLEIGVGLSQRLGIPIGQIQILSYYN
jgi:hypothetical protein